MHLYGSNDTLCRAAKWWCRRPTTLWTFCKRGNTIPLPRVECVTHRRNNIPNKKKHRERESCIIWGKKERDVVVVVILLESVFSSVFVLSIFFLGFSLSNKDCCKHIDIIVTNHIVPMIHRQ
mmetsp:Transcript_3740/g.5549  ORF Transcript_3740/g.5549 Transcript_3740/m.5549 type:complete len:122 (-) Transcript_3740:1221-1586(-)